MTKILDGKKTANEIKQEITEKVEKMVEAGGKRPHLAAILIGNDPASQAYINHKVKACKQVGYTSTLIREDEHISEQDLLDLVKKANEDKDVDGLIVQLPLPKHINVDKVIESIDPQKDVDGFHPLNFGRMSLDLPCFIPATPLGVMELLKRYKI